jgi:small-conductance mechanosensitive channel
MRLFLLHWQSWMWSSAALLIAVGLSFVVHRVLFSLAKRIADRTHSVVDQSLVRHGREPAKLILPLLAIVVALPLLPIPRDLAQTLQRVVGLGVIAAAAWIIIVLADVFTDLASARYRIDVRDNLAARRVQTQIRVVRRIFIIVVLIFTFSIMLMTFPAIRQFGASLLASAGLAGLVIGMAMKPTISSLIAGLQIAMTEPIRIDDVVIVEGEWGWIEEIATTYVVVRIWDLRRLVVPLSYFIEHPFQNWTRQTADLLGTVFVYADYTVPVEEARQALHRILESTDLWDGKVWGLQVTNASEHTMELRALMSASDSSRAWDLRCYVREKLIGFLQERYPESLPKTRAELHSLPLKREESSANSPAGPGAQTSSPQPVSLPASSRGAFQP